MDNFDLKKFLVENKLTTNSKMLSENTGNEAQFKTNEGEPLEAGGEYIYKGRIAKTPRTTVTNDDEVREINVELIYCSQDGYACYFKVLDPEFINRGFKDLTINLLNTEPEKVGKHIFSKK